MGLFAIVLAACSIAWAQAGRAELFGSVRDAAGLAVAGAVVEASNLGTGAAVRSRTGESGEFHFFDLPPGNYTIEISKPDFATLRRRGIALRVSDRVAVELVLQVGDLSQAVEVRAAAPVLQTTSGTEAFVTDAKTIGGLPLDGRNFVPLVALAPGVALPPASVLPRINGSRPRTNEYIYDGISVLEPEPGQVAFYPILDSIQEFRVHINSYSAEYGRSNGGVIQVSTKSGTNKWRGTVFEYFRHEALNARNLFAPAGSKPRFRRNQYGFVLGGPLEKNRTFLFAGWQGTRLRIGNTLISNVPTGAERQGIFTTPIFDPATSARDPFPNNAIPAGRFDPAADALLAHYPLPNAPGAANNYRRLGINSTDQDQLEMRVDRYVNERHRLFGRYTWLRDDSAPATPLPDGSGSIASGAIGRTLTRGDGVAAEWAYTLSPAAVNAVRVGFTRRGFERADALGGNLGIYQIAGLQQIGPPENANSRFTTSVTQLIDTFSTLRAGHSVKAGADIRLERLDILQPPDPNGLYAFSTVFTGALTPSGAAVPNTGSGLASFLLGQVSSFNIDIQQQVLQPRARIAEFFVQDDWKASRRLSLGLGLRYTLNFPSTEANDRGAVFNFAKQQLDFLGRNGVPRAARKLDRGDFGPRASLAFRASDSFVVRSGYGLVWIEQAGITTPFTVPFFPYIQSVGQRAQDNVHPALVLARGAAVEIAPPNPDSGLGQGVFGVDRRTGSGYAQQWNFTLQKALGRNWSLEGGYLGSKLTRLGVPDTNLNQLPAAKLAWGPQLTAQVPNPYYGQIPASSSLGGPTVAAAQLLRPYPRFTSVTLYRNNIGNSTWHALQAHLEKRFAAGLTLTAAYTFSKLMDDASSVFDAAILTGPIANFPVADSFNRRLEKDVSNGDIPQVFSAAFVYELPFRRSRLARGWTVGGVVKIQTGMPLAVTQATNFNAFAGYGTQRPDRLQDPNLGAAERTTARWFNTGAFTLAPQFQIGTSARNPVRGPGYQDADLMLGRVFTLGERAKLEFRAEAFNVSNTPPLGQPNGVLGNPGFGTITSALDPRVFELAVKVKW